MLDVSVSAFLITTTTNTFTTSNNAGGGVSTTLRMSSMDSGWDNDNFLESLSGRNEDGAIDRANEEYFQMSRYGRPPEEEMDYWGDEDVVVVNTQNYNNQQRSPSLSRFGRLPPPDYDPNHNQYQQQQQQQQEQSPPTHSFPPNNLYTANANANANASTNTNANASPTISYADSLQQSQQQPPIPSSSYSYSNPDDISDDFVEENTGTTPAPNDELPSYPEDIVGATFTDEMKTKARLSHNTDQEGASQGGSRFRELMTRAENQQVARRSNPQPTQHITPTMVMTPEEIANLSIDQQARLYREFYHSQQEQQKQHDFSSGQQQQQRNSKSIGSTSTNYLQKGIYGFDGKKIGHNKDIDAISNTSDEYFARLKRDSTTRNIARYSGDTNKANDIFHDPSIADINVVVNPYLQESRQRQLDVIETVPEEMLVFQEFDNENDNSNTQRRSEEENKSFSGISYRNPTDEKENKKQRNEGGSNDGENNNKNGQEEELFFDCINISEDEYANIIPKDMDLEDGLSLLCLFNEVRFQTGLYRNPSYPLSKCFQYLITYYETETEISSTSASASTSASTSCTEHNPSNNDNNDNHKEQRGRITKLILGPMPGTTTYDTRIPELPPMIEQFQHLQSLELHGFRQLPKELNNLSHCLQSLTFKNCVPSLFFNMPTTKQFTKLGQNLKYMQLESNDFIRYQPTFDFITKQLPNLETLSLIGSYPNNQQDTPIILNALLNNCCAFQQTLKVLELQQMGINETQLIHSILYGIAPLYTNLTELHLMYNKVGSLQPLLNIIQQQQQKQQMTGDGRPSSQAQPQPPVQQQQQQVQAQAQAQAQQEPEQEDEPETLLFDSDIEYLLRINHAGRKYITPSTQSHHHPAGEEGRSMVEELHEEEELLTKNKIKRAYNKSDEVTVYVKQGNNIAPRTAFTSRYGGRGSIIAKKKKKKCPTGIHYMIRHGSVLQDIIAARRRNDM
ncbi:hypothetical protein FRACYDRAFT_263537 [Fragilariopsis cylindrus CCMP1102]|uniref:RNI-like protein n=1 Tax=Fragilariopsis cylindrus CCMP1102 TaxID=635003 RepID=A0A1E7EZS2_9STRA|nr:hypothetical protein FRACYDRAFT_263537 [Fragilariopsis cylindrus CCMP1102]|eukprot:OEU11356.1 hypothetical protein FRACYDRAFT_263537 [Fragilariopsis cylindrus CCMP1102]